MSSEYLYFQPSSYTLQPATFPLARNRRFFRFHGIVAMLRAPGTLHPEPFQLITTRTELYY